jgi:fructosamine-3-kinase
MILPPALMTALSDRLGELPHGVRTVGGGDISFAARLQAGGRAYLVKWQVAPAPHPPGWPPGFVAEAAGLQQLAAAGALRVPTVIGVGDGEQPAFILLEWLEPARPADQALAGHRLGQRLAAQHRITAQAYGLDQHSYCGATPQDNTWTADWIEFYGQRRLGFQMALAVRHGCLPASRARQLVRVIDRLREWIDPAATQPSLLHGDLWGGNWLITGDNEPALIDPAVYFGDREAELAMCHLFGGFPRAFYQAYDDAWPPAPGRDERIALYQLYHLLNHLNLFGEGYGAQVDAVLRRYA